MYIAILLGRYNISKKGENMLLYRRGRNHFTLDFRDGRKLLTFSPYAQAVRFNLPEDKHALPLIVFAYQSDAFEKLKWFFCHEGEFDGPPQIVFEGFSAKRLRANLRMESKRFPADVLAKNFGLDWITKKKIDEIRIQVTSEALVKTEYPDIFASVFLDSGVGMCELHLRDEKLAHCLPDYRSDICISTEAEIINPKNS
jgi:hypothetical protein